MFIRPYFRTINGTRRAYWALVESYRSERGPRQRIVAWLGQLDEAGRLGVKQAAEEQPGSTPKSMLKKFERQLLSEDWHAIREGLEVKLCASPDDEEEMFILCRSRDRFQKEEAITRRFEQKIEERLSKMTARCEKQKRDPMKVEREVGRLLGQNTRAARLFDVMVETTDKGHAELKWKKVEAKRDWATLCAGCYLLRTNVTDWSDEELWKAYIQLTEAEAAFRIPKSDLSIRPIWHQKKDRVLAHILVCFLAYVLWKTLAALCERAGLGDEPRRVLDELKEIRVVDVVLPTRQGVEIRKRCITKPGDHQNPAAPTRAEPAVTINDIRNVVRTFQTHPYTEST